MPVDPELINRLDDAIKIFYIIFGNFSPRNNKDFLCQCNRKIIEIIFYLIDQIRVRIFYTFIDDQQNFFATLRFEECSKIFIFFIKNSGGKKNLVIKMYIK